MGVLALSSSSLSGAPAGRGSLMLREIRSKLPSLVFLYMEKNQLEEVPAALPRNLEQLRLSQNQISRIPPGVFSKLENLLLLDLQHNKLSDGVFKPDTFQGLKNLMQLNLAHNTLRKMPPKVPSAIHQLYLDSNRIEAIPSGYFKGFPNLAFIRLNYNQLSDRGLPKNSFNISNLLVLHLSHNRISSVPASFRTAGSMIWKIRFHTDAPSIAAASYSSGRMLDMPAL